jgi:hypothetical protein
MCISDAQLHDDFIHKLVFDKLISFPARYDHMKHVCYGALIVISVLKLYFYSLVFRMSPASESTPFWLKT